MAVGLWLESDRMRSLAITPENLANQKEAVKQERRLSFDNQPYATAIVDKWPLLVFQNWQSSHSLIGSFEDLNSASIDDVSKFFKTYYAPNNAVLTIVGDIQIPAAKKLVETYFGTIPSQPPPKRPTWPSPPPNPPRRHIRIRSQKYRRHRRLSRSRAGLRRLLRAGGPRCTAHRRRQLAPPAQSGERQKSVVQYQGDLGWPFASADDYRDPGSYATFLIYHPSFQANQIVDQYQDEIAKIQKEGVTAAELRRSVTLLLSAKLNELQTCSVARGS